MSGSPQRADEIPVMICNSFEPCAEDVVDSRFEAFDDADSLEVNDNTDVIRLPDSLEETLKIVNLSTHESLDDLAIHHQFSERGVDVLHIGPQYRNSCDSVIIDGPCLRAFVRETEHVSIPLSIPVQFFLENAVDATCRATDGRAVSFYQDIAKRNGLVARLELLVFCFRFKTSSNEVQESYVQNALFLSLNLLGEFESSIAHEVLKRDFDAWQKQIIDSVEHLHRSPLPHHIRYNSREEIEMQIVALLYELLYLSGNKSVKPMKRFQATLIDLTPLDILILYGICCGVRTPIPCRFGISDPSQLQKALLRSRIFVRVTNTSCIRLAKIKKVDDWILCLRSLPIAFPDMALPSQILNEFSISQMKNFQLYWSVILMFNRAKVAANESSFHTYHQLPSLKRPENNVSLLLIWSYIYATEVPKSLLAWTASKDGQDRYRELVREIGLADTPAQIALSLVAFQRLLQSQNDKLSEVDTTESNPFKDFLYLLKGHSIKNWQATMTQATWSFWIKASVLVDVSEREKILQFLAPVFDNMNPKQSSKKNLNHSNKDLDHSKKDLDQYWNARLHSSYSHDKALYSISDVMGKLAVPISLFLLAQDKTNSSVDSGTLTGTTVHESS